MEVDFIKESLNSPKQGWRRAGEKFASRNISLKIPFGGGLEKFWGGTCFNGRIHKRHPSY